MVLVTPWHFSKALSPTRIVPCFCSLSDLPQFVTKTMVFFLLKVSERVERRLQEIEEEMRAERQLVERRQDQLGHMSLQLQEVCRWELPMYLGFSKECVAFVSLYLSNWQKCKSLSHFLALSPAQLVLMTRSQFSTVSVLHCTILTII